MSAHADSMIDANRHYNQRTPAMALTVKLQAPRTLNATNLDFLASGMGARITHGRVTLALVGNEYELTAPGVAPHRLALSQTDAARLDSHWQAYCAANAGAPLGTVTAFDKNHKGLPYRVPNKTGQGSHRFTAHANVTVTTRVTIREYRAMIWQNTFKTSDVEVALYLNGRCIPEGQLLAVKATIRADYIDTFGMLSFDQEHADIAPAPAPIKLGKSPIAPLKVVTTIDCTPTWQGLIPAFIAMIEGGSAESRSFAIGELTRLAAFADSEVARRKATLGGNADAIAPANG